MLRCVACLLSSSGFALAVEATPVVKAGIEVGAALLDVDLPAGSLAVGLAQLAVQTGITFSVEERLVAGIQHLPLRGRFTLMDAFARLLQGTGLHVVREGSAFTLQRKSGQAPWSSPLGETVLPEIGISAKADMGQAGYRFTYAQQATRSETALQELPQSVSVLSAEFIRDQAPQSLADVLRYVPGLGAAQGEGNRDTPIFRGNLSTSDFLLDGLRDDVQYYRDLYNIDRIEALRGPNGAVVGHGAVGGLINRISKQPTAESFRHMTLEAGSHSHGRVVLDLNEPATPELFWRLNLMLEDSRSYRDYFHLQRAGVNPVVTWRVTSAALLTLGFEHFQDRRTADRGVPSYQGRPIDGDPSTFFGNPESSTSWVRLNALSAQLDIDLGGEMMLQTKSRFADYEKFFQNAFPGAVRPGSDGLEVGLSAHNSRMRRTNFFQQADLSWTTRVGGMEHKLVTGIEIGHRQGNNRRETGFFANDPGATVLWVPLARPTSQVPVAYQRRSTDPDSANEINTLAFHVQDQIRLSPAWQATLGLRRDIIQLDADDYQLGQTLGSRDRLWSPRAGLMWQADPAVSVYGNLSIGYALRGGEQLTLLSPANQGLDPEHFVNRELGVKWMPRPELDVSAALYQFDRGNVAVADPQASTQSLLLVDGQRTRGLELGLSGRVRAGWQVLTAYTLQDSRVRQSLSALAPAGAMMPHVPRHNLAVWNRWTLDTHWSMAMGLSGRSGMYASTDNTVRLPGYARWDAALFYAPSSRWRVQLNVENLFDRGYFAFAHNNSNITPGAPRTLRLSTYLSF